MFILLNYRDSLNIKLRLEIFLAHKKCPNSAQAQISLARYSPSAAQEQAQQELAIK